MVKPTHLTLFLTTCLILQLFFTLFAPVFSLESIGIQRKLFLSDLWTFLWVSAFAGLIFIQDYKKARFQLYLKLLVGSTVFLIFVYLHGHFRIPVERYFSEKLGGLIDYHEDDSFRAGRELIVCLRFLSWFWASVLVYYWFSILEKTEAKQVLQKIGKALVLFTTLAGSIMILSFLIKPLHMFLSKIYGFNASYTHWEGRAHGVFQSPVEASVALLLCGLVLFSYTAIMKEKYLSFVSILFAIFGVIVTKSATPVMAVCIAFSILFFKNLKSRQKVWFSSICVLMLVLVFILASSHKVHFLTYKLVDMEFRYKLWKAFLGASLLRWDIFLFGFGWTNYHMDSSYAFIINRTGIIGLFLFIFLLFKFLIKKFHTFSYRNQLWILSFLISGFVLDVFIYRHAVLIFIAAGLPLLATEGKMSTKQ